jgi:hypothetical protein
VRYVSLYTPVDSTPKPPDQVTHLTLPDDTAVLPDLPHLEPEEMREMEMVLRSYWQTEARAPHGDERFKGPPPEELQALGFQAEELAGRESRWEKMEGHLGRDRTVVDRAIQRRDDLWKEAFTDFNLDPPKPHTELVTKQGNRIHVVKWTPELARPEPTQGAAGISHPATPRKGRRSFGPESRGLGLDRWDPPHQVPHSPGERRNGARSHRSRGVGGGNGANDQPSPDRFCRAGDSPPSAQRVAGAGHPAADSGAAKLGHCVQRRGAIASADARCPSARRGTAA